MFTKPEEFIVENFKSMPMWVRIVTYFIVLLVGVYGYVAPKVVVGVAEMKLDEKSSKSPQNRGQNTVFSNISSNCVLTPIFSKINVSKLALKRKMAKRMMMNNSEDWTLVKSKLIDALGV